ncbi:MAG: DUF6261 family protein [Prevotellaceae bacterium]|jgi:hypothetical protein|nr:DUF6261 family protein [Prevotellaceae bacterium]
MSKEFFLKHVSEKPVTQISIAKTSPGRRDFPPKCSATSYFSGNPSRTFRQPFLLKEIFLEMFGNNLFFRKSLSKRSATSSRKITTCRNVRLSVKDAGCLSKTIFIVDRYIVGINSIVDAAVLHFDPSVVEAGESIAKCLKSFGNIESKPYEKESVAVKVMINELRNEYAGKSRAERKVQSRKNLLCSILKRSRN